jgi:hypothetical protein
MHIAAALAKHSASTQLMAKASERYVKSRCYGRACGKKIIDRRADNQPTSLRRMASSAGASIPIFTRRPVPPSRVIWMGPLANSCAMVMFSSTPSAGCMTIDSSARRLSTSINQARASARSALAKVLPWLS